MLLIDECIIYIHIYVLVLYTDINLNEFICVDIQANVENLWLVRGGANRFSSKLKYRKFAKLFPLIETLQLPSTMASEP